MTTTTAAGPATTFPEVHAWVRSLRVARRSSLTIRSYELTMRQLFAFLQDRGMPTDIEGIRREHLEEYEIHLQDRLQDNGTHLSDATVHLQHRNIRAFFNWLAENDYLRLSPMGRMKAPTMTIREVRYPNEDEL